MTEHRAERPTRLTRACAYLGVIGAFHVVQAIIVLTGWYSESGEEQVKRFTDPLVTEGLDRGDAETIYRVFLGTLAVLAASVVVFAIYTAMGHAVSRIMLTITTPPMALLGVVQGSFVSILLSFMAVAFVIQVWTPDVRRWFALLSGKEEPAPAAPTGWPPPLPPTSSPTSTPTEQGQQPGAQQQWAAHPHAYAPPRPQAPTDAIKVLSIIVLIVASIIAAGCAVFLVMYEFAREELVKQQLESGMNWAHLTEAEVRDSYRDLAVLSWVVMPLCLVAIAVSVVLLVRRRRRG